MKNLPFFIFISFLQSCSLDSFDQQIEYRIDPLLKPYVDQFYKEAEVRGIELQRVNLIVKISTNIGSKYGLSESINGQKVVSINSYLIEGNDLRLQIIIFHELGHSLLNRHHFDDVKSIMNTSPCSTCFDEQYLDELFYAS